MSACFNVWCNKDSNPESWSIKYGSESSDILEPLGLVCNNGTYEDCDYNKKTYRIEFKISSIRGEGHY